MLFLYEVRTRQGMFETLRAILDYMKPITSYLFLRPNVWLIANLDKIKDSSKPANVSHLFKKKALLYLCRRFELEKPHFKRFFFPCLRFDRN